MLKHILLVLIASMIVVACASPKVVERRKLIDKPLSCSKIKGEMDETE